MLATAPQAVSLPFRLYRPAPGHPDWPSLAAEAGGLARRLAPGLEPARRGRAERRRRARSYATTARCFLTNRRLAKQGREDLRPLYFIWTLLRTCNFRCTYCDDHRGQKYPDLPNDGVLNHEEGLELLRVMRTGTSSVYFAGGEPTLRKDLPQLTRAARDLDYYPIVINTNGSAIDRLLAQDRWSTWLADTDVVVVSLDGLDLAQLGAMWAYRKPVDVIRNLLLLRELAARFRVKLMVNCVIQPGRIEEARHVLDFANDLGIWYCPVPMNVGPRVDRTLLDDPDYRALVALILKRKAAGYRITGSTRMNRRLLGAERLQCRNTLKPHIDFDGQLLWPCKASVHVAPERIRVLDFDSVDALYEHAVSRVDPTRFHGPARNQCGASCNWAQNYTTDAYARGLTHPASLAGDLLGFLRG